MKVTWLAVLVSVMDVCVTGVKAWGLSANVSMCDRSAALPLSHPQQHTSKRTHLSPLCLLSRPPAETGCRRGSSSAGVIFVCNTCWWGRWLGIFKGSTASAGNVKFRSTLPRVLWFLLCYLSCEHSPNENQTFLLLLQWGHWKNLPALAN